MDKSKSYIPNSLRCPPLLLDGKEVSLDEYLAAQRVVAFENLPKLREARR